MKNIEDCVFDEGLPVNTIVMLHRGIEIFQENQCNNPKFMNPDARFKYRKLMWLLCNQFYDIGIDLVDEWRQLKREQEKRDGRESKKEE